MRSWVVPEPVGSSLPVLALRVRDGLTGRARLIGHVLRDEAGVWSYDIRADRDVDLLDHIDAWDRSVTERVDQALRDGWRDLVIF